MAGNPREHAEDKGFWDRGEGHTNSGESGGRTSGSPGRMGSDKFGVSIDLDDPSSTFSHEQDRIGTDQSEER